MFNPFKKKPDAKPAQPPQPPSQPPQGRKYISEIMRDTVWGDRPLDQWPKPGAPASTTPPWNRFVEARSKIEAGKPDDAVPILLSITETPDLESRHYLQAWKFLRELKYPIPADKQNRVYGVIFEVGMPTGLDLLVAYGDHHARFYSHAGGGTIWEHSDNRLDNAIDALLQVGQKVVDAIGSSEKPRPPVPTQGLMRFSMLTPAGMGFGQGTEQQLMSDNMGKVVVVVAANLLNEITKITAGK